jgi:hypothetical protein
MFELQTNVSQTSFESHSVSKCIRRKETKQRKKIISGQFIYSYHPFKLTLTGGAS